MNQHIYPPTQKHKTPYMNLHKNPHNPRPFTEESQLEGTTTKSRLAQKSTQTRGTERVPNNSQKTTF